MSSAPHAQRSISYALRTTHYALTLVFAQEYALESPIAAKDVPTLLGTIIQGALGIAGSIALVMFVYGGFTWLTSGGNPDKIKKGKDIMLWAALGITVIFVSYSVVRFIFKAFGAT